MVGDRYNAKVSQRLFSWVLLMFPHLAVKRNNEGDFPLHVRLVSENQYPRYFKNTILKLWHWLKLMTHTVKTNLT